MAQHEGWANTGSSTWICIGLQASLCVTPPDEFGGGRRNREPMRSELDVVHVARDEGIIADHRSTS